MLYGSVMPFCKKTEPTSQSNCFCILVSKPPQNMYKLVRTNNFIKFFTLCESAFNNSHVCPIVSFQLSVKLLEIYHEFSLKLFNVWYRDLSKFDTLVVSEILLKLSPTESQTICEGYPNEKLFCTTLPNFLFPNCYSITRIF